MYILKNKPARVRMNELNIVTGGRREAESERGTEGGKKSKRERREERCEECECEPRRTTSGEILSNSG